MTDEELMSKIYLNKIDIDSANQLYEECKKVHPRISKLLVLEWFSKIGKKVYHQKVGVKSYLPIYSELPYSFQIDLTFLPRYKKYNNGNYVLFTAIDINTRYVHAYFSKNKESKTVLDFLKSMMKKTLINSITCDKGSEFNNKEFLIYCDDNDIYVYLILDDSHKLGIINRFHRSLKELLTLFFTKYDTLKWIDVIDDIIKIYNRRFNRGIGCAPIEVNTFIENEIIQSNKKKTAIIQNNEVDYKEGDKVLIKNKRGLFDDKMNLKYSSTVYKVISVTSNSCIVIDDKSKKFIVKKSDMIMYVGNDKISNKIDDNKNISKFDNRMRRTGLDSKDILESKRRIK